MCPFCLASARTKSAKSGGLHLPHLPNRRLKSWGSERKKSGSWPSPSPVSDFCSHPGRRPIAHLRHLAFQNSRRFPREGEVPTSEHRHPSSHASTAHLLLRMAARPSQKKRSDEPLACVRKRLPLSGPSHSHRMSRRPVSWLNAPSYRAFVLFHARGRASPTQSCFPWLPPG